MPIKYIGLSFFSEIDHNFLRKFFTATNIEKFEMAFWAQKKEARKAGVLGLIIGSIITIIIILILNYFFKII